MTKTAMITIAGRPNVGKSTLVNRLTGDKIAIVSDKPQTTRNRIFGVINDGDTQIVLLDTPGYHVPRTRLGDYMVGVVKKSIADVDAIALLIEPNPQPGPQELALLEHITAAGIPAILVINKIDTAEKDRLLAVIGKYSETHAFNAVVPVSAKTGDGADRLLSELNKFTSPGPKLFPEDVTTDQPEKQVIAEILREKLLLCLQKEIPHGTAVEITKFSERGEGGIIDIDATIYCEKASHKGMIIGNKGSMLKRIGELARIDIERFMGAKIFLQTWVKVKENWRDNGALLRNFGYTD
jgi:GTP-binding protein Era